VDGILTAEWVEGIPPDRAATLMMSILPPSLPEVNGFDSCPITLATVAAIRTFRERAEPLLSYQSKEST
jgi:hypothetical protein